LIEHFLRVIVFYQYSECLLLLFQFALGFGTGEN